MIYCKEFDFSSYTPEIDAFKKKIKMPEGEMTIEVQEVQDIFTFDYETTSYYILKSGEAIAFDFSKPTEWYEDTIPQALSYIWMFGINDTVIYGRTNTELNDFINELNIYIRNTEFEIKSKAKKKKYHSYDKAKMIVYVHNLGFDFQFLRNALGSNFEIFSRKAYKPMKVTHLDTGIEFRCSYFLTNKNLATSIKDVKAPIEKLTGSLDYNVIRTPLTKLTDKEHAYCENDILGLYHVIKYESDSVTSLFKIPLTQTGKVRAKVKKALWKNREYRKMVHESWPDWERFKQLSDVYSGGYTHANRLYTNKLIKDVYSYDITSSYPYVLCTQKYPTKRFTESLHKNFDHLDMENYAFIADVTLTDIEAKTSNSFLSVHKCKTVDFDGTPIMNEEIISDNGRLVKADKVRYVLTDSDLLILNREYKFAANAKINAIYTAPKDYLPKEFIELILGQFKDKTEFKNVVGYESRYKESKEHINAVYGMFVTKVMNDDVVFDGAKWDTHFLWDTEADKAMIRAKFGDDVKFTEDNATFKLSEMGDKDNFTQYSTGVWCAAYARKHLWDVMHDIGNDVVYCDTDSIKFINEKNLKYFKEDNKRVDIDIAKVCISQDIDPRLFKATAPDGKVCELGYFEEDGMYKEFKTLGAKKYAYTLKGEKEVHITVAGVNKKTGAARFKNINAFRPGVFLGYEYAGKNIVKYNNSQQPHTFPDGWTEKCKYGVVLTPTTYVLDITSDYADIIGFCKDTDYFDEDKAQRGEGTCLL